MLNIKIDDLQDQSRDDTFMKLRLGGVYIWSLGSLGVFTYGASLPGYPNYIVRLTKMIFIPGLYTKCQLSYSQLARSYICLQLFYFITDT